MYKIDKLQFTKFLDVKSPQGIIQRSENLDNYSIGVDLYLPKITSKFIDAIIKSNLDDNKDFKFVHVEDGYIIDAKDVKHVIAQVIDNSIRIFEPIQIPTGIGILIPNMFYATVDSKSSNFKLGWTEIQGKIDMNYTYGMGVQIIPLKYENNKNIAFGNLDYCEIVEDQKFAQLIMHEAVPILEMQEIPLNDWENSKEVNKLRGVRAGGFGNGTGKM